MLEAIAESATIAWPLALTCATVVAADRVRAGRRRDRLNLCLHELRRPLQAMVLDRSPAGPRSAATQLDLALDALAGLDRQINGGSAGAVRRLVDGRALLDDARARWLASAEQAGRRIEVAWRAGRCRVLCDPAAVARALDNLIVNALEHGSGGVGLAAGSRDGRLRLVVFDGGGALGPAGPPVVAARGLDRRGAGGDPGRGHGLRVVAAIAAEHGGRFAICRDRTGTSAVLELPLADG
jgi:signal transduction histidine kinase